MVSGGSCLQLKLFYFGSTLYSYNFILMLHSTTNYAHCVSPDIFLFHLWRTSLDPGPLPASSRAGIWVRFRLSWPSLFPFSRNRKAARHLLNSCRFSQRLRKPGDLNGMPTRGSSRKIITEGNPVWGPWWWTPSSRVADSWKQCKDPRLFQLWNLRIFWQ